MFLGLGLGLEDPVLINITADWMLDFMFCCNHCICCRENKCAIIIIIVDIIIIIIIIIAIAIIMLL